MLAHDGAEVMQNLHTPDGKNNTFEFTIDEFDQAKRIKSLEDEEALDLADPTQFRTHRLSS